MGFRLFSSGKKPLEYARIPNTDRVAARGMGVTIPDGRPPGRNVANLAFLGYDPAFQISSQSRAMLRSVLGPRQDFFPIQDGVPEEPVIRMVQVPVHRIEVESDDPSLAGR
jgi:hypothetical protein